MVDLRLEPLWGCVVIEEVSQVNGIHIPGAANGGGLQRGFIRAVSENVRKLRVGDEVFFAVRSRAMGTELIHFEGRDYVVCESSAVVARVRVE